MGHPGLIDLGLDREVPDPGPDRIGRWWTGAGRRWTAAAAAAVLAGAVAGSAAPPRSALAEVFSAPIGHQGEFSVSGETLFVLRVDRAGPVVAAYGLRDGARRWQTPASPDVATADDSFLVSDGGTLALVISRESPRAIRTFAYDAVSGVALWNQPGRPLPGGGADHVLLARPAPCPVECDLPDGMRGTDVRAIGRHTGEVRWRVRLRPGTAYAAAQAGTPRLATVDTDGRLTVRDVASGTATGARTLAPMPRERLLLFVGDILLVQVLEGLSGYHPGTLTALWTVPVTLPPGGLAFGCARLLCTSSPAGTYGIEPSTGAVRWRRAGSMALGRLDERHLMTHSTGGGPVERGFDADVEVIEAETGARLFVLHGWEPMAVLTGTPYVLIHRWHETRSLIWLGELRADQRAVRRVGSVPGVGAECTTGSVASRSFLVCRTADDRARVWRLAGPSG